MKSKTQRSVELIEDATKFANWYASKGSSRVAEMVRALISLTSPDEGWIACPSGIFCMETGQTFDVLWEGGVKGTKIIAWRPSPPQLIERPSEDQARMTAKTESGDPR